MRKLQRVVQDDKVLALLDARSIASLFGILEIDAPLFCEPLVFVAPVAEAAHSVDVERVLALANVCCAQFGLGVMHAFVHLVGILLDTLSDFRRRGAEVVGVVLELPCNLPHLAVGRGKELTAPRPVHLAATFHFRVVEVAARAVLLRHHRRRLQPVCENDVRIHGGHVQVINVRLLLALGGSLQLQ